MVKINDSPRIQTKTYTWNNCAQHKDAECWCMNSHNFSIDQTFTLSDQVIYTKDWKSKVYSRYNWKQGETKRANHWILFLFNHSLIIVITVSIIKKIAREPIQKCDNTVENHIKPELNSVWFYNVFWHRNILQNKRDNSC